MIGRLRAATRCVIGAGALASRRVGRCGVGAGTSDAERHGISAFGDLKYPADFKHFDYVNPNAPKGGAVLADRPDARITIRTSSPSIRSTASSSRAMRAQGMELTFATLMARAGGRARRDVWACGARGADLGRRADLSLSAAAGGALPRRQPAHRARRRLLAQRC